MNSFLLKWLIYIDKGYYKSYYSNRMGGGVKKIL